VRQYHGPFTLSPDRIALEIPFFIPLKAGAPLFQVAKAIADLSHGNFKPGLISNKGTAPHQLFQSAFKAAFRRWGPVGMGMDAASAPGYLRLIHQNHLVDKIHGPDGGGETGHSTPNNQDITLFYFVIFFQDSQKSLYNFVINSRGVVEGISKEWTLNTMVAKENQ
jgi:hypothetical protein